MWHDIAPDAATAALAVIGALHVAWAFTPWPAPTYQALSKYVYGGPGMPPKQACITIGALLIAAAYGVLAVAGTAPRFGPEGMYRLGVWTLAAHARGARAGPSVGGYGSASFFSSPRPATHPVGTREANPPGEPALQGCLRADPAVPGERSARDDMSRRPRRASAEDALSGGIFCGGRYHEGATGSEASARAISSGSLLSP